MPGFEVLEENLRAALRAFAGARPSGDVHEEPGLALASAGVDFATFNAALLTAPLDSVAELRKKIETAAAYFSPRRLPWSFWLCEGWLAVPVRREAGTVFWEVGLHLLTAMPGMAAERILAATRPLPVLEYRRVADEATRSDFKSIMAVTFDVPLEIGRQIYESESTWRGGLVGHVGYADGEPATTAATLAAAGAIGLYAIGTLPPYQKRGHAEAIARHALRQAREDSGLERSVLESTPSGYGLYRRLGYRTVTNYSVYAASR